MNKLLLVFLLTGQLVWAQENKDVKVNYMLRGYFYAYSSVADTTAAGGFGLSDNNAEFITSMTPISPNSLRLYIDTTQITTFSREYKGYTVYLINATDTLAGFSASDSRLSISAEAFVDNGWKAIEYLPSSWCGNSYHTLYLPAGQYWSFAAPIYKGSRKIRLRYKLIGLARSKQVLYSNEVTAYINEGQLTQQ